MLDIDQLATNLVRGGDGVWTSRNRTPVSYPDDGHAACFAIEEASFWFRHRSRCILEIVRAYPPAGAFFDVGGGNGLVTSALAGVGIETVLVEPGEAGVRNAKTRGVRPIVHATLQDAAFKAHSLPAVGLFDVLEHVEDDVAFLNTIRTVLTRDGRLYATAPAYEWLWSVADEDAGHYRRHTVGSLSRALSNAGFRVEFASYFFGMLVLPIFLLRHLPTRLGIRRRAVSTGYSREHGACSQRIAGVALTLLGVELAALRRRIPLPFGASCLVVASPLDSGR